MIRTLLAISILLSSARADVHLVAKSGPADFQFLFAAVAAAQDGDLILLMPGDYSGPHVDGRSITIVAVDDQAPTRFTTSAVIQNLLPHQTVAISGVEIAGGGLDSIAINNCSGAVLIHDCTLSSPPESQFNARFRRAVSIEGSSNVALTSCQVSAVQNYVVLPEADYLLSAAGSFVALSQSDFIGRDSSCDGGTAINLNGNSFVFASECLFKGGDGGSFSCPCGFTSCGSSPGNAGGDGGNGARIGTAPGQSLLLALASTFTAGQGGTGFCDDFVTQCDGTDGEPFAASPDLPPTTVPGVPRSSLNQATVLDGASFAISANGLPGDQVTLVLSKQPAFDTSGPGTGVRHFQPNPSDPTLHQEFDLGTLTGATLSMSLTVSLTDPNLQNETWIAQTVFTDSNQDIWYGPGRSLTVHKAPFGSEFNQLCQGDGGDQMGCANCPCSNNAPIGTGGGCLNSTGRGALLFALGDTSISLPPDSITDLEFRIVDAPVGALCVLTSGDGVAPTNPMNPCFGLNSGAQAMQFDGLRCAVLNTRRHGGRTASLNGSVGYTNAPWGGWAGPPVGIAQAGGGFASGQTRYFQVIHRDDPTLICMRALNSSEATEIQFTP